jgi:hypothetical protein
VRSRSIRTGLAAREQQFRFLAALCLIGLCCGARLARAEVVLKTSVDRDTVYIADPVVYTVDILAAPDVEVTPPAPERQLGPFEVRDYQILPPEETATGQRRTRILWTLVPFQTGQLEIPTVQIVVGDTAGTSDTLQTRGDLIEVASLNPDLQGDIRDIKPPAELPGGRAWIAWLIGGLVLAAGALWLARSLRRRRLRHGLEKIPYQGPPRPAHRIALEELDRIAALNLLSEGMIKEFYTQVCDVIRRYIEGRYALRAVELTTWELIGEMKRNAVPEDHREGLESFLGECDLVKFAKYMPPAEVRQRLLPRARQLVLLTRITPVPPASENARTTPAAGQPAGTPGS